VCEKSVILAGMLEEGDEEDLPIQVVAKELKTVMTFCDYIKDNAFPTISKPLATKDFAECLSGNEWFIDFV
jgi:hypothetical protein